MNNITIENYRCFGEQQTVPLAPLTLLVGPNSTGKTSFLALVRALWDVAFRDAAPNFMEDPYNLGSFQDIVHRSGLEAGQAKEFTAGFEHSSAHTGNGPIVFSVAFEDRTSTPFPVRRVVTQDDLRFEAYLDESGGYNFQADWDGGSWTKRNDAGRIHFRGARGGLLPLPIAFWESAYEEAAPEPSEADGDFVVRRPVPPEGFPVANRMERMLFQIWGEYDEERRPFASAPIRSRPRRTYDPVRVAQDPEGEYIPSYLASLSRRQPTEWSRVKSALEQFGQGSGLFEEISVRSFGDTDGDPFQILIKLPGEGSQQLQRNLIDVGYGVSQSLPVLTELLSENAPTTCLLQQPEVHLHPSAQAALGSLFCTLAGKDMRLLVETHSEYLLDRIRMDVRDRNGDGSLGPDDVSILYFERCGPSVRIHPVWIDENGNVRDAPDSYGDFFMAETSRSIGL